jgi:hypothetical protein
MPTYPRPPGERHIEKLPKIPPKPAPKPKK